MCSNNSSQSCKDSLSISALAHKDITTRFHSFYLDQGIKFTFPARSMKIVQTPHQFRWVSRGSGGLCPSYGSMGVHTSGDASTAPFHRIPHLSPLIGAFRAHTSLPSLPFPPLPTSPPVLLVWGNRKPCSAVCILCWSLWSTVSLGLCLYLIRGESIFQGSYKRKFSRYL